jgi:hypothetical protein
LSGAIVAAQVYAALGVELSLGAIADHPTVSTLAAFIDESRRMGAAKTSPVVRVPRAATMPMSLSRGSLEPLPAPGRPSALHAMRSYRVIGPLDIEILKECLSYLIDRHEILRTTFGLVEVARCRLSINPHPCSSRLLISLMRMIQRVKRIQLFARNPREK